MLRHEVKCEVTKREEQKRIRRAYPAYCQWFTLKKRVVPSEKTFSTSSFAKHFLKLVDWADKMSIVSTKAYVCAMVAADIPPEVWCRVDAYVKYLETFHEVMPEEDWIILTVNTITQLTADYGVHPCKFFDVVHPNELIHLLRVKAIMPQYLVCDANFAEYLTRQHPMLQDQISDLVMEYEASDSCTESIKAVISHVNSQCE